MQVVVVGGAGVLGQALTRAIVARGVLTRSDGSPAPVRRVIAVDRTQLPRLFVDPRVEYVRADLSNPRLLATVMGTVTDSVFHAWDGSDRTASAPTPSFALIDSLRDLFAACTQQASRPKVVLASSYAANPTSPSPASGRGSDTSPRPQSGRGAGGEGAEGSGRGSDTSPRPQSGRGAGGEGAEGSGRGAGGEGAKGSETRAADGFPPSRDGLTALVGELLLTEAVRRGNLDGRALRLALIADAPGCASFVGDLLRALRDGRPARCPIARDTPLWLTSAPAAALALVHAHELPALAWAETGPLNAPARSLSVDTLLEALGRLTGASIDPPAVEPDAALCEALAQRPRRVPVETSLALGFEDGPDAGALVRELVPGVGFP